VLIPYALQQRERPLWNVVPSVRPEERGECVSDDQTYGCTDKSDEQGAQTEESGIRSGFFLHWSDWIRNGARDTIDAQIVSMFLCSGTPSLVPCVFRKMQLGSAASTAGAISMRESTQFGAQKPVERYSFSLVFEVMCRGYGRRGFSIFFYAKTNLKFQENATRLSCTQGL